MRFFMVMAISTILAMAMFSPASHASSTFEDAYFRLEANVFDRNLLGEVVEELNLSTDGLDKDPWIYLCASMATLVSGYRIGDWYSEKTFAPGAAERALDLAEKAKSVAPDLSQAHAHYARILIIQRKYKMAWESLGKAHELDPNSFYSWYFRGIIAEKMRDAGRASGYFDEAEQRVAFDHQRNLINIHRQKVARFTKDYAEQEKLLKQNIENSPNKSTYYGNYAQFLMAHKRYEEAVEYWEKAMKIGPYPHAAQKLSEARQLLESESSSAK